MRDQVIAYMVKHYGFIQSKASELADRFIARIRDAERFKSFPYYAADQLIRDECVRTGVSALPDDYFDPNWVEPPEEEEESNE